MVINNRTISGLVGFVLGILSLGTAQATVFNFDVTFDGVSATVDASSDPIAGTTLIPSVDGFNLDIHTAGNDLWNVISNTSLGIYAGFFVRDSGDRIGNVTTTFFLDGTQVAQDVDLSLTQSFVHIGAQSFSLTAGTMFDQVVVDYTLLTSNSAFTTIQNSSNVVDFSPFFRNGNIEYVAGVPEPATLALMGFGLAGLGFSRKRKAA